MNSDEDDDIKDPKKLPIYLKGEEIYDLVLKLPPLSLKKMSILWMSRPVW